MRQNQSGINFPINIPKATAIISFVIKFIPIDIGIQKFLDKPETNKVANYEDLVKETSVKEPKINDKITLEIVSKIGGIFCSKKAVTGKPDVF